MLTYQHTRRIGLYLKRMLKDVYFVCYVSDNEIWVTKTARSGASRYTLSELQYVAPAIDIQPIKDVVLVPGQRPRFPPLGAKRTPKPNPDWVPEGFELRWSSLPSRQAWGQITNQVGGADWATVWRFTRPGVLIRRPDGSIDYAEMKGEIAQLHKSVLAALRRRGNTTVPKEVIRQVIDDNTFLIQTKTQHL